MEGIESERFTQNAEKGLRNSGGKFVKLWMKAFSGLQMKVCGVDEKCYDAEEESSEV